MKTYSFTLDINYERCEQLYTTGNNTVLLRADTGERIQLPSLNLRPFVTRAGLNGRFQLVISKENKVLSFERII